MYSKRFRDKVKECKNLDWAVYACWLANIRRFPNTDRETPDPLFDKHIGE